ncbi:MAG: tetratricopeptide repeat-containing sulfotransferase family protein [Rhizobiaceae bacterium]
MAKPFLDNNSLLKIQKQVETIPTFALQSELNKVLAASRQQPKNPLAQFAAGLAISRTGDQFSAINYLENALKLAKGNEVILGALAYICAARMQDHTRALKYLRKKLQANRRDPATLMMLANSHLELGNTDKALETLEIAEPLVSDKIRIHGMRSRCYLRKGDSAGARKELLAISSLDPSGLIAVADMMSSLPDNTPEQLDELEKVLSDALKNDSAKFRDDSHRSLSAVSLGNIYESRGEYEAAFDYYVKSNNFQPRDKTASDFRETGEFEVQRAVFTEDFFKNVPKGHDSEEQVFVLGMPRSGTTLIESVLAAHSRIEDFGELEFFAIQLHGLGITNPEKITVEQRISNVQNNLRNAPATGFSGIGEQYIQTNGFQKKPGIFKVDKMPQNFRALGLIATVFPNAKVIHSRRHPMDTCLSVFKNPLRGYHTMFANNLETLGKFYIEYAKLMRYWSSVLPTPVHEVRYEDMVASPEVHSRGLINFLGLDWQEECLINRKAKRDVNTASLWQVRQDIYKTSVEKWRVYEKQLAPLSAILKEETERYEAGE